MIRKRIHLLRQTQRLKLMTNLENQFKHLKVCTCSFILFNAVNPGMELVCL